MKMFLNIYLWNGESLDENWGGSTQIYHNSNWRLQKHVTRSRLHIADYYIILMLTAQIFVAMCLPHNKINVWVI